MRFYFERWAVRFALLMAGIALWTAVVKYDAYPRFRLWVASAPLWQEATAVLNPCDHSLVQYRAGYRRGLTYILDGNLYDTIGQICSNPSARILELDPAETSAEYRTALSDVANLVSDRFGNRDEEDHHFEVPAKLSVLPNIYLNRITAHYSGHDTGHHIVVIPFLYRDRSSIVASVMQYHAGYDTVCRFLESDSILAEMIVRSASASHLGLTLKQQSDLLSQIKSRVHSTIMSISEVDGVFLYDIN